MKLRSILALGIGMALAQSSHALTSAEKDLALNSYNNAFYVVSNGVGYYLKDTNRTVPGRDRFWQTCEEIEMVEDAYERTGNTTYKNMIGELINGLNQVVSGTQDWASWNTFNDDIMWGVIALVRSYRLTGNTSHLSQAQIQFNKVWNRAWDSANGGLYQTTPGTTKNACVNGPAVIAGIYLAWSTTGTGFRQQAQQAFNWEVTHLFNTATGQVADHLNSNGTVDWGAFTYNQGTFIGAATLMYQDGGNGTYLNYAGSAATWTKNNLTGQHVSGILNDEYDSNGGNGDGPGFKGIFSRWCARYANQANNSTIKSWLTQNANAAWSYRNSSGLMWGQWWRRSPDGYLTAWECSSGVAIAQNAP